VLPHAQANRQARRGAEARQHAETGDADTPVGFPHRRRYTPEMGTQRSDEELDAYLPQVLIGELESPVIEVVDYDPAWAQRFRREAATIHKALGGRERLLEHVGSTAVPGLAAKPIVDILLVVNDSADERSYLSALEAAGYVLRIREPEFYEHRMLRTPARDVHVHVFPPHAPEVRRLVLLRDWLRGNAADRDLYAATKRRLAARHWPTMQHYAEAKTEVIEALIARAIEAQAEGYDATVPSSG
jgi:GrpB-like predicted nucleotidyltransferase (UPF0157 family)